MCRDTWKVIQCLQLLFWNQMRPYSSVKSLCGLSYSCFPGTRVLRQLGETGPEYPKSRARIHKKESKVFSSLFYIKWDLTLVSRVSVDWVIPVSQVLEYWDNLGKPNPNTPNHAQEHTKSNPRTSAPHLTSNEVSRLCQGHLRVQLYLSCRCSSIRVIWGNRVRIPPPQIIWSHTWKVIQSLQFYISH